MGWLLATLMGCHGLSQTGPSGMKGVVLDAQGYPVSGLRLASIEAEGETDAKGSFAVAYKSDAPYLQFEHLGAWYRRHYQAEDRGHEVTLALPQTRDVQLECPGPSVQVELNWALEQGFDAYLQVDCAAAGLLKVQGVPVGTPTVKVRGASGEEAAVELNVTGSVWAVEDSGSAAVFEVQVKGSDDVEGVP